MSDHVRQYVFLSHCPSECVCVCVCVCVSLKKRSLKFSSPWVISSRLEVKTAGWNFSKEFSRKMRPSVSRNLEKVQIKLSFVHMKYTIYGWTFAVLHLCVCVFLYVIQYNQTCSMTDISFWGGFSRWFFVNKFLLYFHDILWFIFFVKWW